MIFRKLTFARGLSVRGTAARQSAVTTLARLTGASLICAAIALSGSAAALAGHQTIDVDCGVGDTIAAALGQAHPGDTINITGTCNERVTIATDRLTLAGTGNAVIDGDGLGSDPVITIDGARGVALNDLTVQDGGGDGISAGRAAEFSLTGVVLQDNPGIGLKVGENSTVRLEDVEVSGSLIGVDVFTASTAVFSGLIEVYDNVRGIEIVSQAIAEVRGDVVSRDNFLWGIAVINSELEMLAFPESAGSSITARDNGLFGFILDANGVLGAVAANSAIVAEDNTIGFLLDNGSRIVSPFGAAQVEAKDNAGPGMQFGTDAGATINGGLNVVGNGVGIVGDGAGVLVLTGPGSTIKENFGPDLNLSFGTRARVNVGAANIGVVVCDGTVLLELDGTPVACPAP